MFFKRCRHERLSDVKDGYQYCVKCNKAFPVEENGCKHNWEIIEELHQKRNLTGNVLKIKYILQCQKCGEIKTVTIE